jgi:hypothetical protein
LIALAHDSALPCSWRGRYSSGSPSWHAYRIVQAVPA